MMMMMSPAVKVALCVDDIFYYAHLIIIYNNFVIKILINSLFVLFSLFHREAKKWRE